MASTTVVFLFLFSLVISMASTESNRDARNFLDDLSGMIGKDIADLGKVILPKESQRAACQSYGYLDPQFVKTGGKNNIDSAIGHVLGFGLDVIGNVLPLNAKKGWREGCIRAGLYHPDQQEATPAPEVPPPGGDIIYVQDPPTHVTIDASGQQVPADEPIPAK